MSESKPKLSRKSWWKMTEAEREAEFRAIDAMGEIPLEATKPLTKAEITALRRKPTRAQYEASRGRGRPRLGGVGAKHINVTIEPALLAQADAAAKQKGLSRSALFSLAVKKLLKAG